MIDHWQGRHGLGWSFWVNLVALRVALFLLQEATTSALSPGQTVPLSLVLPLVVVFHGGLFIWQVVGLLRAADAFSRESGQMFKVWGVQLGLIVSALWVLSYSLEAWHLTQPHPDAALPSLAEFDALRAKRYALSVSPDETSITLEGSLELGITKRLSALLDAHPAVTIIHLTSPGGNIFEARGLATQIETRGLATSVETECSSACTLVFVAGRTRKIAVGARLGFHQYRFDTNIIILAADPKREQERDIAAFRRAGVAPWFLDQIYQSGSQSMWYPDISELKEAGVVTDVLHPSDP